jgi:ubiquinone/menaquinone biosynthesis C-methylase UbiE
VAYIDKNGVVGNLPEAGVTLELGCGQTKRHPDAIGIDALDYDGVDIVGDVFEVLDAFPDRSVDAIFTYHFMEHVEKVPDLLEVMARILKADGTLSITVPHFSNPHYYSDITHRQFFGLYTMSYFSTGGGLRRKVPTYQREIKYKLEDVRLIFKSSPPFYIRHGIKKLIEQIVNVSAYTKELYEESFCYLSPCYEVRYTMSRTG